MVLCFCCSLLFVLFVFFVVVLLRLCPLLRGLRWYWRDEWWWCTLGRDEEPIQRDNDRPTAAEQNAPYTSMAANCDNDWPIQCDNDRPTVAATYCQPKISFNIFKSISTRFGWRITRRSGSSRRPAEKTSLKHL